MEEKINIAEILKNKPRGTKLYDWLHNIDVELDKVHTTDVGTYIECTSTNEVGSTLMFDYSKLGTEKCWLDGLQILLPSKGMRDWEKFSWKRGDVLKNTAYEESVIFDGFLNDDYTYFKGKHPLDCSNKFDITYHEECNCFTGNYRLESTDAAQTYINTIEERLGGKLNRETLEIEQAHPEFKDGDIVFMKGIKGEHFANCIFILRSEYKDGDERAFYYAFYNADDKFTIAEYGYTRVHYSLRPATDSEKLQLFDALEKEGKAWDAEKKQFVELKPKIEFKPFDKVVVRDTEYSTWCADLFSHIDEDYRYACVGATWSFCIPYNEETAKLIGTTNNVEG